MKCDMLFGLCLFCLALIACIVSIFLTQGGSCPVGTFACKNTSICLPRKYYCDNNPDCPNGDDEDVPECVDIHGFNLTFLHRPVDTVRVEIENCTLEEFPQPCNCRRTKVFCNGLNLTRVPTSVSRRVSRLALANNKISVISSEDFGTMLDLELLHLQNNCISEIPSNTFHELKRLTKLFLGQNLLKNLQNDTFKGLDRLMWLFMQNGKIQNLDLGVFRHLPALKRLDLSMNNLSLAGNAFPYLPSLEELDLEFNRVREISISTFMNTPGLLLLNIRNNAIRHIEPGAFGNLKKLRLLDLSSNDLRYLSEDIFASQANLLRLCLGNNPLLLFPSNIFLPLKSLQSLDLNDVEIPEISVEMFSSNKVLDFIYFKKFYYCSFAPHVNKCQPKSDGVSSLEQLLDKTVLRGTLWVVAIFTLVGNCVVLYCRGLSRNDNIVLSYFVKNLAVADILVGIYLVVIGERDLRYRDQYHHFAHEWMVSWQCTLIGSLSVMASEVSILLLAFMSLERFLHISCPYGDKKLTEKTAIVSIILIWIIGFSLAAIPAIHWRQSTRYYGSNSLCFPLHIDEPRALGWEYSSFLFLGLNFACIILIAVAYVSLFLSIRKTRGATPLPLNELEIAVRFFFLILTDCLCWCPIIALKFMALCNFHVSADLYAWLVIFILPVNSALNPFLYTFTTPKFRSAGQQTYHRLRGSNICCSQRDQFTCCQWKPLARLRWTFSENTDTRMSSVRMNEVAGSSNQAVEMSSQGETQGIANSRTKVEVGDPVTTARDELTCGAPRFLKPVVPDKAERQESL